MKKTYIRILFSTLFFLGLSSGVAAQTKVRGVVSDRQQNPIAGAMVIVDNTAVGTTTHIDGTYEITVPAGEGHRLVFSFFGYRSETVPVSGASVIDVTLADSSSELDEVVVVGYGTMRKSDITGSVTSVKIDEAYSTQIGSLDQLLQGRAAGVQVTASSAAPGAGVDIRIRGNSSFNGGGEPLYVVDGVILNPPTQSDGTLFSQGQENSGTDQAANGLLGLNPQDIASMEVLKDASATAIYGSQGANGVVLITTKMGMRERVTVNWTSGVDISRRMNKIPLLDLWGYVNFIDSRSGGADDLQAIFIDPANRELGLKVAPIDWQDYVMRQGISHRHRVSVSSRTATSNYMIAAGYSKTEGIVLKTGLELADMRINFDKTLGKSFRIGMRVSASQIQLNMMQGKDQTRNSATTSLMKSMLQTRPFYDWNQPESADENEDENEDLITRSSPVKWLTDFDDSSIEYRVTPNFFAEVKLTGWLTYRVSVGGDYRNKERTKWKGPTIIRDAEKAITGISNQLAFRYNADNLLMFEKRFGEHRISGTLGSTFVRSKVRNGINEGWTIIQYIPQSWSVNAAPANRFDYIETESATLSFLSRMVYSYQDKYVLTATYRADGSSKFSKENRYSYFPSFAFAWRATEERWFPQQDVLTNLKVRLGWGRVGNEGLSPYQTLSTYSGTTYPNHEPGNDKEAIVGSHPTRMANMALVWETTEQYNVGIDMALFKNRMMLTVDLYDKSTKDLLQQLETPGTIGFATMWVNQGEIRNRGIEFSLDGHLFRKRKFNWDVGGNIAFNRNKIVTLGIPPGDDGGAPYILGNNIGSGNYFKNPANIFIEGHPMGLFWGFRTDGIVQDGETGPAIIGESTPTGPGGVRYVLRPENTTGALTEEDRWIIGDPNPKFTFGFGTNLSYGNLSLGMSFNGVYGNDIMNANLYTETDVSRLGKNLRRESVEKAWTPESPHTSYPSLSAYRGAETAYSVDRFVEDGSFLRLSNVTLTYTVPLPKTSFIQQLSFSASVNNAYVWTKYSGWDPEVNSFANDMFRMGVDQGSYPSARTFSFGVNATF